MKAKFILFSFLLCSFQSYAIEPVCGDVRSSKTKTANDRYQFSTVFECSLPSRIGDMTKIHETLYTYFRNAGLTYHESAHRPDKDDFYYKEKNEIYGFDGMSPLVVKILSNNKAVDLEVHHDEDDSKIKDLIYKVRFHQLVLVQEGKYESSLSMKLEAYLDLKKSGLLPSKVFKMQTQKKLEIAVARVGETLKQILKGVDTVPGDASL